MVFLWRSYLMMTIFILLLHVDDMLAVGHDASKTNMLKGELNKSFAKEDLRLAK